MNKQTFKYHIISRVVLDNFCDAAGRLKSCITSDPHRCRIVYPEMICYKEASHDLLKQVDDDWQKVETALPHSIACIRDGTLFKDLAAQRALKKIVAIHYVRSNATERIFHNLQGQSYTDFLRETHQLDSESLRQQWRSSLPVAFKEATVATHKSAEEKLEKMHIEIGVAPDDCQFIISDNPVVNISGTKTGKQQGVGLVDIECLFMPLTPKYAVSFVDAPELSKYQELDAAGVSFLNQKSLTSSNRHYFASMIHEATIRS